jgi:cell division septation protein DedD
MNHIVINHAQRRQYLLILVGAIVFSFGLGFWFGYHMNSSDELAAVLSQPSNQESQDDEKQTPDWSGETRSAVDTQPVAENKPSKPDIKTTAAARPVAAPAPVKPAVKPVEKPVAPVVKPVPVTPAAPVVSAAVPPVAKPVVVTPVVVPPVTPPATTASAPAPAPTTTTESITNSSLSAEAANTQYVVQAGVFENYDNAMKLVTELNNKGFDAYVDEFVASSGELKFNVRFGRSSDRDQVQKRLVRFKQLYTTAAYIITLDK